MIEYRPTQPCCGVQPTYRLLDEAMAGHFSSCPGGTPEAPLVDWAWSVVGKPGGLLVDIGAHVGTWSLPFALAGMRVVAFEPNQDICPLLSQSRPKERMVTFPVALSDRRSLAELHVPGPDGGMGSLVVPHGGAVQMVDTDRLDTWGLAPDVIKIDVEGAELDVLRGAERTIREHKPTLFFECWEDERGQRIPELFGYVTALDYTAHRLAWPEMWMAVPCSPGRSPHPR